MAVKKVCISIGTEQWAFARQNSWSMSQLVRDGIASRVKPDVLKEQLDGLRNENEALRYRIKIIEDRTRAVKNNSNTFADSLPRLF
jgi:hypothetical protein